MPQAAKRPCRKTGCPKLSATGYCDDHTELRKAADRYRGNAASRGYDHEWSVFRLTVLRRDNWLCLDCLAAGRVTSALDVDHVIPLSQGGERLDATNCRSLCRACHRAKTAADHR